MWKPCSMKEQFKTKIDDVIQDEIDNMIIGDYWSMCHRYNNIINFLNLTECQDEPRFQDILREAYQVLSVIPLDEVY